MWNKQFTDHPLFLRRRVRAKKKRKTVSSQSRRQVGFSRSQISLWS